MAHCWCVCIDRVQLSSSQLAQTYLEQNQFLCERHYKTVDY